MFRTVFHVSVAAMCCVAAPLGAATIAKTYDEASASVTDDGYVLFVYGKGWDRTAESLCRKMMNDPAVQQAAGSATFILTPFYQQATEEQKTEQSVYWGALAIPNVFSAETYPALLMYDKNGRHYASVRGPVLLRGTAEEVAEEVKRRREGMYKQRDLLLQAEKASGVEKARLLGQASIIPDIYQPHKVREQIKALDPQDQSGFNRSLAFQPSAWGEKHAKSTYEAYLPEMEKMLKDNAYSPEQKQGIIAVAIGLAHKRNLYQDYAIIRDLAAKMKALAPDSQLGRSADVVTWLWGQPLTYEKGWNRRTFGAKAEPVELAGDLPIRVPGTYTFTFVHTGGADAVRISSVEARSGNTVLAKDVHDGVAGRPPKDNDYILTIRKIPEDLKIFVTFQNTEANSDANGKVVIIYGRPEPPKKEARDLRKEREERLKQRAKEREERRKRR